MQRRWGGWSEDNVCDDADDEYTVVDWRNSGIPVEVKSKSRAAATPPSPPYHANEWTRSRRQASAYPSSHRSTYNTRSRSVTPSYDEYDYSNCSERPSVQSAQPSANTKRLSPNDTWFNDIEEIDYSVGTNVDIVLKPPSPLAADEINESGSKTTQVTQPQIPLLQVPQPILPLEDLMVDITTKSKSETAGKGVKRKRAENGTAAEDSIEEFLSKSRNRTSARNYAKPSKNKVVLGKELESTDVSGQTKNVSSSPSRKAEPSGEIISTTQPASTSPLPDNEVAEEEVKGCDDSMDSDPNIENPIIKIRTDIFEEDD